MASVARLFLLMLLSSFLVFTISAPSPQPADPDQAEEINKIKEGAKATGRFLLGTVGLILDGLVPFLALIPIHGTLISAATNLALLPVKAGMQRQSDKILLGAIMSEFEDLNSKLDQYRLEQRWDSWASGAYHKPELDINVAWQIFKTMIGSVQKAKTEEERKRHLDDFTDTYSKYEPATKTLHELLKARGTTFISNLGDLLAEKVKCHEKELGQYNLFINQLIFKGNMMNQFYYRVKGIVSEDRAKEQADIAYNAASVMFQVHKDCISKSMDCVIKDVEVMIDKTRSRDQLALEVREFLEKTYNRYDWMVVAYITKSSDHKVIETLNKHVLDKFTKVTRGEITVAVARQVKGKNTKAEVVRSAIENCVPKDTLCYKVTKKLSQCTNEVEVGPNKKIKVSETYTAVHAYTRKPHDSHEAQEVPEDVNADPEEQTGKTPYIYIGDCKKNHVTNKGKFVVLMKSEDEMKNQNACSEVKCKGKGKCFPVPGVFVGICECPKFHYGEECEHSLEDYQNNLMKESGIVKDSRTRNNPTP